MMIKVFFFGLRRKQENCDEVQSAFWNLSYCSQAARMKMKRLRTAAVQMASKHNQTEGADNFY